MKSFKEFLSEDAASATQSTISGGRTGGKSGVNLYEPDREFKERPKTGIGGRLKQFAKDRMKPSTKPDRSGPEPDRSGPGQQPDRKPQPYRSSAPQRPQSALPPGKERPALPASKDSMVAQRTAAAKQPPQHQQISARPASTAMAGSRQRPAIRPGTQQRQLPSSQSSITKRGTNTPDRRPDIQGVSVRDVTQRPKALPSGQKQLPQSQQKALPQSQQKALPPAKQRQLRAANG
jgi:hypothetical protein